ncbi:MAG: hypothetical protein O3C01_00040 [Bacteroidetes bacterium]|nr:hypothetical protein [Bacteroidota bacterium]MDA1018659.1 hypothetical protein [Bacteroidota bacterium]
MKKYLILFALISPFFFISCDVDGSEMSDDELIEAIIDSENKILISNSDLPSPAISSINFEMPNDFIDEASLAPELGYEIEMKSFDFIKLELDYEREDELYFTTEGRKLNRSKGKKKKWKRKGPCFKFEYPLSYVMPDNSTITGNDRKEVCIAIKKWYEININIRVKPQLIFPLTILMLDDDKNVVKKELQSHAELRSAMDSCKYDKNKD